MCAIAGILDLPAGGAIHRMLRTMTKRGPDATAYLEEECCTLLHARLVVVDNAGGAQPMTVTAEGETFTIVYNGELYNTEDLRGELQKLGHSFRSHSDTEVLLHAYAQFRDGCLPKLNGIFAFAVWEHKAKRLFLARDRMGVKPLFYKLHQGGLLFGSEIKTILAYPTVTAQLDPQGAAEILLLGPGRTPGCGVFRDVMELEPGCCGYYEAGRLSLRHWWKLLDREHRETFEETAEQVRWLVKDAIQRQMVSDVPIGTFLSGGLDSSIITAVISGRMREQGGQLPTFSVDYTDNDKYFTPTKFQPNSDGYYIRLMQEKLGTEHHWCVLTPQELLGHLEEATHARDLPGMADVDFSLLAFCKRIRQRVTVALSGECADEIFGGYPWFRDPEIRDRDGFPWAQNTLQRCETVSPALGGCFDGEDYIRSRYETTCRESDILPGTSPLERRMKEMANLNQRWFMQTLLDRKDRMSMYSGLEVRVPFCDHRIAEYLYGVPWQFKDYQGKEKGLLRYAMEGILPPEVLWRKKSPYPKTWHPQYLQMVAERVTELLNQDVPLWQLVSRDAARKLLEGEQSWPWYGQLMGKAQTLAYLLQIQEWLTRYQVELMW